MPSNGGLHNRLAFITADDSDWSLLGLWLDHSKDGELCELEPYGKSYVCIRRHCGGGLALEFPETDEFGDYLRALRGHTAQRKTIYVRTYMHLQMQCEYATMRNKAHGSTVSDTILPYTNWSRPNLCRKFTAVLEEVHADDRSSDNIKRFLNSLSPHVRHIRPRMT